MTLKAGFARGKSFLRLVGIASLVAGTGCGGASPSGMTSGGGGSQPQPTGGSSAKGTGGTNVGTGGAPGTGGSNPATGGVPAIGGSMGRAGQSGGTGGAAGGTMGTGGPGAGGSAGAGAGGAPGMCPKSMATFNDIMANHTVPAWLKDATYAIGMHFGPYSVGAHHNEWDSRNMYCDSSIRQWYIDHFGSNGKVGYKDLIAKMTLANFHPESWATVFKKAKASIVFGSAEHCDRFAMWNSPHTKWCIAKTAGHDVIGELAAAVRAQGMKFGVLDHMLYGYSFQWCGANADKTVDLYDPQYLDLYGDYAGWDPNKPNPYASSGPPNGGCSITSNGGVCQAGEPNQGFMNEWLTRAKELTDQYQPDIHWFDWDGVGATHPTKLAFASYYYNSACGWGKEVAIAGRVGDFPSDNTPTGGNVMLPDFERNAPASGSEPKAPWFVNIMIGSTWSYTDGMTYQPASTLIKKIKDLKGRGGMALLNVSPKADGTLPQEQIDILTAIGNAL